jgi:uncharacterized Zn finger protein
MIKCPYCGYEGEFTLLKTWKYRWWDVKMVRCPRCGGVFNYYYGISPKNRQILEFTIKIKPKR